MNLAMKVVRHIKNNLGLGLLLSSASKIEIKAYCGSNWDACLLWQDNPWVGISIKLWDSLISWKIINGFKISTESEYMAMALTTCKIIWIQGLLQDIGFKQLQPTVLFCDNKVAKHIPANPVLPWKDKASTDWLSFTRKRNNKELWRPKHPHRKQIAYLFPKALSRRQHHNQLSKLGLFNVYNKRTWGEMLRDQNFAVNFKKLEYSSFVSCCKEV